VHELFLTVEGWQHADLSALTGAPDVAGAVAAYVRSDGVNSVIYTGYDGHIHEIYLTGGIWRHGDPSLITGAVPATGSSNLSSDPAGYVRSDGVNSVVYCGWGYHIYELYLTGGNWQTGDLSALAGAPFACNPIPR